MQTDISKNWLRLLKIVDNNEDAIFKNYLLIPIHSKLVINYGQDLCLRVVTSTNMVKGLQKSDLFSKKNNIIGTVGLMCSFLHGYENSLHIYFFLSYNEYFFHFLFDRNEEEMYRMLITNYEEREKVYLYVVWCMFSSKLRESVHVIYSVCSTLEEKNIMELFQCACTLLLNIPLTL